MTTLKIGQLAKAADVSIHTIRFYEHKGLLPDPPRRPSGYRQYEPESAKRIRFIKHSQSLGFSLREIEELLTLRVNANTPNAQVKRKIEEKNAQIVEKMHSLQRMQNALTRLTNIGASDNSNDACPMLEAFAATEDQV